MSTVTRNSTILEVLPTGEARAHLHETLERFRREGAASSPMVFGAHRRAEAVVIPYDLFESLLPVIDDASIAALVRDRLASDEGERVSWEDGLAELGFKPNDFE